MTGCCLQLGLLTLAVALAGCATQAPVAGQSPATTAVDQRMFFPEGAAQYQLRDTQAFVYPQPHDNPSPKFPADFPNMDVAPTHVCVSFVVAVDGGVQQVAPAQGADCAPSDQMLPLLQAAMQAVSQWSFDSALLCSYPDIDSKQDDRNNPGCNGERVTMEKIPVTLSYAFVFESKQGATSVHIKQQP